MWYTKPRANIQYKPWFVSLIMFSYHLKWVTRYFKTNASIFLLTYFQTNCFCVLHLKSSKASSFFSCRKQFQHPGRALSHQGSWRRRTNAAFVQVSWTRKRVGLPDAIQIRTVSTAQCARHEKCREHQLLTGTEALKAQGSSERRVKEFL